MAKIRLPSRIRWSHVKRLYELAEPVLKASAIKQDNPGPGPVLVLSPHIDDDLIGAGGSIIKHVRAGDDVRVVYFCDCTGVRIKEAQEVSRLTGINRMDFLGLESKRMLEDAGAIDRLSSIIDEHRPRSVYLPSLIDRHNDHLAVNHFLSVLQARRGYGFEVYAFEVWTALIPNLIIDITDVMDGKRAAISLYKSQLKHNNWVEGAEALNRYRAVSGGAGRYAEGFMRYSAKEYFSLWSRVYAG